MQNQLVMIVKSSQCRIDSDLNKLPQIVQWFEQFKDTPLPKEIWLQANMALIEGFTNAVRHAHSHLSTETPVLVTAEVTDADFVFEIWDQGESYDFDEALANLQEVISAPDFDPLAREKQWGGVIFLKLIQQFNWKINYLRHDNAQNCLKAQVNFT